MQPLHNSDVRNSQLPSSIVASGYAENERIRRSIVLQLMQHKWDFAFVGMGAANGLLLRALEKRGALAGKRVAIFEPRELLTNDKTYCFWAEADSEMVEDLKGEVDQIWSSVRTHLPAQPLGNLRYHRIDAQGFYQTTRELALRCGAVWIPEAVTPDGDGLRTASGERHVARRVFCSIPPRFEPRNASDVFLLQSFVGAKVRLTSGSPQHRFDPETFAMMDFGVPQGGSTRFMYTLPYSETEALVELTQFGAAPLPHPEGRRDIAAHLESTFPACTYEVLETETGAIPMTSIQPQPVGPPEWVATGTAAGMLKPSTGYAFKQMHAHARAIARSEDFSAPPLNRTSGRFAFYDHLLLMILERTPEQGKRIFEQLLSRSTVPFVMRFLDEGTHLGEEMRMFARLPILPFLRAVAWRIRDKTTRMTWVILLAVALCALQAWRPGLAAVVGGAGLFAGLFAVGIPHGALDAHIAGTAPPRWRFITKYLLAVFGVWAIWWWSPGLSLLAFLVYSAFHFGQSDVEVNWPDRPLAVKQRAAWLWGTTVLAAILLPHGEEVRAIVGRMGVNVQLGVDPGLACIGLGLFAGALRRTLPWASRLLALFAIGCWLPVWLTFGLYFVGVHSLQGWNQIQSHLSLSSAQLFRLALPYNLASWAGMAGLLLVSSGGALDANGLLAAFFVLIAGISLPHIFVMHRFFVPTTKRTWGPTTTTD